VATCTKPFNPGENVGFTPSSTGPFELTGWSGECSGNSCGVTMNGNHTVTANFKIYNAVSVVPPAHGAIQSFNATPAINCGNGATACSAQYPPHLPLELTTVAAHAFKFDRWTLGAAACGTSQTCSVPFSGRTTTISADFKISGACAPGDTDQCCSCATQCCGNGTQTCDANGNWGTCSGSICAPDNGECP
jgi:hypothetical protein